jgi:hypothetical protein
MEPVFGSKGTMIGWLKGDVIYDMNLRPCAIVRDGGIFENHGCQVGELDLAAPTGELRLDMGDGSEEVTPT